MSPCLTSIRAAPLSQLWAGDKVPVPKAKADNDALANLLMSQLTLNGTDAGWLGKTDTVIDAIQLTPQGTTDLVRALAHVTSSKKLETLQDASSNARRCARLSQLRCYMGGVKATDLTTETASASANATTDTEAPADPADPPTTLRSTAEATATKLLDQMSTDFASFNPDKFVPANAAANAGIDAVRAFMAKLSGDEIPGLPEFLVDANQAVGHDCKVTLCHGSCDAGKAHRAFAVAGATKLLPGCGHDLEHGLCAQCQPFQNDDTLNVCARCKVGYRNPQRNALTMWSVTSAVVKTAATSSVGHIKMCYLDRKTSDAPGIYTLTSAAVDGPARMDPSELDMLAKASPSLGEAKAPQAGDQYRLLEKLPVWRKQLCGRCLRGSAPDNSLACSDAEVNGGDVKYIRNRRDIVGLVAAQAATKDPAERQRLREQIIAALGDPDLSMKTADKTFLKRLSGMIENSTTPK